ncbi:MAG: FHA domain-containing protein, partial [Chloroflexota bacterium]|nr:FHA domain-containing protein [Chloroflexota bacterium]
MMGSTCPYCGADTRPGDNFCLNCGNRLLTGTPSSQQQAEPAVGESTLLAQDGGAPSAQDQGSQPVSSGANWSGAAPTIASSNSSVELPTTFAQHDAQSVGQATSTASATIERPAMFILHADNGDVLQEYVLEKPEISIGRAPNSDILLSKDKLTSRRHATVTYQNGKYILHDERSANGTFVNGQQLEEMASHELQDDDHVGIGEHELIFRGFGSSSSKESDNVSEMPTVAVQYNPDQELTYRTQEDENMTSGAGDDFSTKSMGNGTSEAVQPAVAEAPAPYAPASEEASTPSLPPAFASAAISSAASNAQPAFSPSSGAQDIGVSFNSLNNIPQPTLPDIAPLMAALSTLDG